MPVAFDVAKLLFIAGRPRAMIPLAQELFRSLSPTGGRQYVWTEQLAIGLGAMIAKTPERRDRAARVGRLDQFHREQRARLGWMFELVDDSPTRRSVAVVRTRLRRATGRLRCFGVGPLSLDESHVGIVRLWLSRYPAL